MATDRDASPGLLAAALLWLMIVVVGMATLRGYASTLGPAARAGMTWPSEARTDRRTLPTGATGVPPVIRPPTRRLSSQAAMAVSSRPAK